MSQKTELEPPDELNTVSDRLRYVLFVRNMGMNELDRAMGKGRGYTSRLLNEDREPRLSTLGEIARAVHVPFEWLSGQVVFDFPRQPAVAAYSVRRAMQAMREAGHPRVAEAIFLISICWPFLWDPEGLVPLESLWRLRGISLREQLAAVANGMAMRDIHKASDAWSPDQAFKLADYFIAENPGPLTNEVLERFRKFLSKVSVDLTDPLGRLYDAYSRRTSEPRLKEMPEWDRALRDAQKAYPSVLPNFFDLVGNLAPAPAELVKLDWQLVGDLARSFHDAARRWEVTRNT